MILIDTHVHIHDRFRTGEFFDAAAANFANAARAVGCVEGFSGVLCLTDTAKGDCFDRLAQQTQGRSRGPADEWTFNSCPDGIVLRAEDGSGRRLWIAAGRQIVSRDGLEVLALCTTRSFSDRSLSLDDLVGEVLTAGAAVYWQA